MVVQWPRLERSWVRISLQLKEGKNPFSEINQLSNKCYLFALCYQKDYRLKFVVEKNFPFELRPADQWAS